MCLHKSLVGWLLLYMYHHHHHLLLPPLLHPSIAIDDRYSFPQPFLASICQLCENNQTQTVNSSLWECRLFIVAVQYIFCVTRTEAIRPPKVFMGINRLFIPSELFDAIQLSAPKKKFIIMNSQIVVNFRYTRLSGFTLPTAPKSIPIKFYVIGHCHRHAGSPFSTLNRKLVRHITITFILSSAWQ